MARSAAKVRRGSENVFGDLGYPDAATHLVKARLVSRIQDAIDERRLTQVEASKILGIGQPDISRMLRGNFRDLSIERLMRFVRALGYDIEIVVSKRGEQSSHDTIRLQATGA